VRLAQRRCLQVAILLGMVTTAGKGEFKIHAPLIQLTKAQIIELTDKDAGDLFVLFHDHDVTADDDGISSTRVAQLCGQDWGLWRTVTGTLKQLEDAVAHIDTTDHERACVTGRIERLLQAMHAAPKSRKWKMRNRVGDRVQWYVLPEEPNQAIDLRTL